MLAAAALKAGVDAAGRLRYTSGDFTPVAKAACMPNSPPELSVTLPTFFEGMWAGRSYIPLEAWRTPLARAIFGDRQAVRAFRSSGTTGATRSLSLFSPEGLAAYKTQSVAHFKRVLHQVLPPLPGGDQPMGGAVGLSLIPPVSEWPDSSLAQMVAWLGEELPLHYVTGHSWRGALDHRPVWLFGTAFHLLNVIDAGLGAALPAGSVIIETGGSKGQAREVTREELYRDLAHAFQVPMEAVISEYGMCELACQAYDFVPHGEQRPLPQRRFQFAPGVDTAVVVGPGLATAVGRGALVVHDPLRLDAPLALRTEDLADLTAAGFKLLGRAPTQPLKGCSLLAEDLAAAPSGAETVDEAPPGRLAGAASRPALNSAPRADAAMSARVAALAPAVREFLAAPSTLAVLSAEFGSSAAAVAALADTSDGLPTSLEAWCAAALAAAPGKPPTSWLMIPPANHSLVGLYPLAMAYILGWRVGVRPARRLGGSDQLLAAYMRRLQLLPECALTLLPAATVTPALAAPYAAVLAYGSSETIAQLSRLTELPVRGFGSRVAVSVIAAKELAGSAALLARDALSLGQTGCMSTRLIVAYGELPEAGHGELGVDLRGKPQLSERDEAARLVLGLSDAGANFWQASLPWRERVGLDFEAWRLASSGAHVWHPPTAGAPLVAVKILHGQQTASAFATASEELVARTPFCLPVLWCRRDLPSVVAAIKSWSTGRSAEPSWLISGLGDGQLGSANRPQWDGSHEGQPLFSLANPASPARSP